MDRFIVLYREANWVYGLEVICKWLEFPVGQRWAADLSPLPVEWARMLEAADLLINGATFVFDKGTGLPIHILPF
jgi:hypothetical protein